MDLSLTENQQLLRNTAQDFIQREYPKEMLLDMDETESGVSPELWEKVAGMGWLGLIIPEEYGGDGGSLTDAGVLFEELGKGPVPGPYFSSSILSALTVLEGGTEEQKQRILPSIARGGWVLALAITEPDYAWGPEGVQMTASRRNGNLVFSGTKLFVYDASAATHLICALRTDQGSTSEEGISLVLLDKGMPGISVRRLPGFLGYTAEVTLDSVEVPASAVLGEEPTRGWHILERAAEKAIPVLCAHKVGGCQSVADMSIAYSQTRIQFGTPIGRFQRVQDHIINIVNHLDAARWTTYEALWKLDTGRPASASVHMAKAVASEGYYEACNSAHETHAGVGIMREYGLTLHTKMSRTLYHFLGDPRHHRRRLAQALEL